MWSVLVLAAAACDGPALVTAFAEVSPAAAGDRFAELAACDATAARTLAPEAFKRIIAGPGGDAAARVALGLGGAETVRAWIVALEPDDRGPTLARLGDGCDKPEVAAFFVDAERALGDRFYAERWWAALDSCRAQPVQVLLGNALQTRKRDRTLFGGLLDVYARNLGEAALPLLKDLAASETDPAVLIDIVDAIPDAAGVGEATGANPAAVTAATRVLRELAPRLPDKAADGARKAFLALNDEQAADGVASVRFRSVLQPDGGFLYGVVAIESATCKKGDARVEVHHALVRESGDTWPDQLAERTEPGARGVFDLNLAESCKGTGTVNFRYPEQPFKDEPAYKIWLASELAKAQRESALVNLKVYPYDPLSI